VRLRLLSRSPVSYWVAVCGLAVVTAMAASGLLGRARSEAARYGSPRPVLVATHDIAVGERIDAGDVQVQHQPAAMVPPDALSDGGGAAGRTAVVPVFRGQAVLARHVSVSGRSGPAALLPPGTKGIAVPAGPTAARLTKGDAVDVLATFDPSSAEAAGREPTFPVATAALVVDVAGESATLAVDADEAKRVAFAMAHGAVTVVLTSPLGSPKQ
jgi:Flp pilus assembly protein CpaB